MRVKVKNFFAVLVFVPIALLFSKCTNQNSDVIRNEDQQGINKPSVQASVDPTNNDIIESIASKRGFNPDFTYSFDTMICNTKISLHVELEVPQAINENFKYLLYKFVFDTTCTDINSCIEILRAKFIRHLSDTICDTTALAEIHPSIGHYQLAMTVDNTYNFYNLHSFVMRRYIYTGGAHGWTEIKTLTYYINNNKILTLSDLMYIDTTFVINYARNYLSGVKDSLYEGCEPDTIFIPESYSVTSEGIKLYFSDYDIWPYACGTAEVLLPFDTISNLLRPHWKAIFLHRKGKNR